jgi:hypothetical protein
MAVVALAAALLSYQSLAHLGWLAGYGDLSFLYPIVVDAGAAASCATWLHSKGRQPLLMTWCLLAVSVVLNGTVHYLESTHTPPSWLLVVAVAAVPPTVLGLCVHLAVGMGGSAHSDLARPAHTLQVRDHVAESTTPRDVSTGDAEARTCDPLAELISQGAGRRKVADVLGVSEYQARKLMAASKNGDGS